MVNSFPIVSGPVGMPWVKGRIWYGDLPLEAAAVYFLEYCYQNEKAYSYQTSTESVWEFHGASNSTEFHRN